MTSRRHERRLFSEIGMKAPATAAGFSKWPIEGAPRGRTCRNSCRLAGSSNSAEREKESLSVTMRSSCVWTSRMSCGGGSRPTQSRVENPYMTRFVVLTRVSAGRNLSFQGFRPCRNPSKYDEPCHIRVFVRVIFNSGGRNTMGSIPRY